MNQSVARILSFPEKSPYKPETARAFLAGHDDFMAESGGPAWLQEVRREAAAIVRAQGLPAPELERWKYTNLNPAVRDFGGAMSRADVAFQDPETIVQWLSDTYKDTPEWIIQLQSAPPPGEGLLQDQALWHLSNAYLRDGLLIDLPRGKTVEKPLYIDITGHDGGFFMPRTLFRLAEGSSLTVIEHHRGEGHFWNNRVTQIIVEPGAHFRHYRLQDYSPAAAYTQNTHVQVGRDATYDAFTLTVGAGLSRNQVHVELTGSNSACHLNGVNLLRGAQHGDTTLTVDHQAPNCASHQFYRSVLDDRAHGVFQGRIHVARAAQKTDGYQLSNSLLLSEGAEMDVKPELEIYADDVKCSHGATTGQLDEDALFYLRSRGIGEAEARGLLITAFIEEAINKIPDEAVRTEFLERARSWLNR